MPTTRIWLLSLWCVLLPPVTYAETATDSDELAIPRELHAYFDTDDLDEREKIAARIAAHPDYDRNRMSEWLHNARLFSKLEPGQREVSVPLGPDLRQQLLIRVPDKYDPQKPWPLLYALHGMGSNGEQITKYFEHYLGPMIEEFVVVAPHNYRVSSMRSVRSPKPDHRIILREIRRRVHIDANRQYASGYSMGGHASWTLAATLPDEFAAIMPLAGSFANLDRSYDRELMPNMANTFVACIWGRQDVMNNIGEVSNTGGIAGRNQRLSTLASELELPFVFYEFKDRGHAGVKPPEDILEQVFSKRRVPYPPSVRKTFRDPIHARAYWLEGQDWIGPILDGTSQIILTPRPGENPRNPEDVAKMRQRALLTRLANLEGAIDGQTIKLNRRKIRTLIVWFGDGMIDWDQKVTLRLGSRRIYDGQLEPDLFLCLQQVDRTWDLDRLRWVGLRIETGEGVDPITGRTEFPTIWTAAEAPLVRRHADEDEDGDEDDGEQDNENEDNDNEADAD